MSVGEVRNPTPPSLLDCLLHRIGEPMDVAGVVVFLASSAACLITGETILIDGGWTAR
jgi:NAD(P)-dependent dehydrogenase (short-subunit alcohol dehydrogenase family)